MKSERCLPLRAPRQGLLVAAVMALGSLVSGCVSAVDDTSSFGFNAPAKVAQSAAAADGDPGGDDASVADAAPAEAKADAAPADTAPPDPARLLTDASMPAGRAGIALEDRPIATGTAAIAAFAGADGEPGRDRRLPGRPEDGTLYDSLFAQSKAKTPIRNAEAGKGRRVILKPEGAPVLAALEGDLPGVKSRASLFEIGQRTSTAYDADIVDEASEDEGSYQVASLSGMARLAPNGLTVQRPDVETSCFQPDLLSLLQSVEARFHTKVIVTSGYRSPAHNSRVHGAKRSMHMGCKAADIQVPGADRFEVAAYVRSLPNRGGVGTYCHTTAIHVDTGRARDWNWACRRRRA